MATKKYNLPGSLDEFSLVRDIPQQRVLGQRRCPARPHHDGGGERRGRGRGLPGLLLLRPGRHLGLGGLQAGAHQGHGVAVLGSAEDLGHLTLVII